IRFDMFSAKVGFLTSRKPRLSGGLPTEQPPPLGLRTKVLIGARCLPSAIRMPHVAGSEGASTLFVPRSTRLLQVEVHSQTLPAKSISPVSLIPNEPFGCGWGSVAAARLASRS